MVCELTAPHPEDIKAAVRKKEGKTLSALAREANLSESALHKALRRSIPAGEKVIARYLGVPLQTLWPDRWTAEGQQIPRLRLQNGTAVCPAILDKSVTEGEAQPKRRRLAKKEPKP